MRTSHRTTSRSVAPLVATGIILSAGCRATYEADVVAPPAMQGEALPVEFVLNLPVIEARIGNQPVRLIVDVGGHDNITLTEQAIASLPTMARTGRSHMSFDAAGRISRDEQIIVPELRLGEVVIQQVHGHTVTLPEPLRGKSDGYIGAGLLKRFRLLVDYPMKMVLLPAVSAIADNWSAGDVDVAGWAKIRIDHQQRTEAAINGRPIASGWDTGASHTVIDDDLARKLFDRTSGSVECALTLDGKEFEPVEMRIIDLRGARVDVLVGHNFFARHRVLFDFPNGIVYVEPHGGRASSRSPGLDLPESNRNSLP